MPKYTSSNIEYWQRIRERERYRREVEMAQAKPVAPQSRMTRAESLKP